MSYNISISTITGNRTITIADAAEDSSTSLTLIGFAYKGWGQTLNQNIMNLMQHFAAPTGPSSPNLGQMWLNTATTPVNPSFYDGNVWVPLATRSYVASHGGANASAFGGDLTGGAPDANGIVTLSLANSGTPGTYNSVTTDAKGRVVAGSNLPPVLSYASIITGLGYTPIQVDGLANESPHNIRIGWNGSYLEYGIDSSPPFSSDGTIASQVWTNSNFISSNGGTLHGNLSIFSATDGNHLRLIQGGYGAIIRNDGANLYLLTTDLNDVNGRYNAFRPFSMQFSTGNIKMGSSVEVGGGLLVDGNITAPTSSMSLSGLAVQNIAIYDPSHYSIPPGQPNFSSSTATWITSGLIDIFNPTYNICPGNFGTVARASLAPLVRFYASGQDVGTIQVNASSTAYTTASDYRLKNDLGTLTGSTDRVKKLMARNFTFKNSPDSVPVEGFFAHELQEVVPSAVVGQKDDMQTLENIVVDTNDNVIARDINEADFDVNRYGADAKWYAFKEVPKYQSVDQAKVVPLLVGAIQELLARVEMLESKLAENDYK